MGIDRGRSLRRALLPLVLLAFAEALVVAPGGGGYLALVKALGHGTARIDAYHWWTPDVSWWHGHYYSPKAPLVAFLALPLSLLLSALGLQPGNPLAHVQSLAAGSGIDPLTTWPLVLLVSTLAGFALLLLVRDRAERVEPGYGTAAAVAVGAGTMLLPFSTLLFDHVLSALLAFAAFWLLWREREGSQRPALVVAAGLLAGLAVVAEYPAVLAGAILGVYALARPRMLPRAAAYAAGVLVGVAPLFAYNAWAFGSPFHLSYVDAVSVTGNSGHDHIGANASGFFGVGVPSPHAALDLLFQHRGLLVISPVLALAAVGLVALFRRGLRAETAVIAAISVGYFVYDAGYYLPFGGDSSGPRFLIATLPFLGVALAPALRVARWPTVALLAVSVLTMLAAVSAPPLGNDDTSQWLHRVGRDEFQPTLLTHLFGWHGIAGFFPVVVLVAAAVVLALAPLPWTRPARREVEVTVFALWAWAAVAYGGGHLLGTGAGAIAVAVGVIGLALVALALAGAFPQRRVSPAMTSRESPDS